MLAARRSTIPGRRHKMVFVDFSNPYLRDYLAHRYLKEHTSHIDRILGCLGRWLDGAQEEEARLAAALGRSPRPLGAVVDIDEVILSNIHMNSFAAPAGAQGPEAVDFYACDYYAAPGGGPWPRGDLRLNPLLPGSRRLLQALAERCEIFLVTGRLESIRDETVENLVYVGLASPEGKGGGAIWALSDLGAGGSLRMCPDESAPAPGESIRPFKEDQRRRIEETHRIAVNIGDQVSDLGLHGDVQALIPHPFYHTP